MLLNLKSVPDYKFVIGSVAEGSQDWLSEMFRLRSAPPLTSPRLSGENNAQHDRLYLNEIVKKGFERS